MSLSNAQATTLVLALRASADATVVTALQQGDGEKLLKWCNQAASPAVKAWVTAVQPVDSDEASDWASFDTLQAGKRDSWIGAFLTRPRDFSKAKVRKWVTDVWGNATAGSAAEKILQAGQVNCTNAEIILGGTTDTTTNAVTGRDLTWRGPVGLEELGLALARNP